MSGAGAQRGAVENATLYRDVEAQVQTLQANNREIHGSLLGGRYRVIQPLGEGGMGAVYEVERTADQEHLAAKILKHPPNRSQLGRFIREAQILARLSHPNLIGIVDVDITDHGVLYIVMELVRGASLRLRPR